jgi:hypothetical protein
MTISTVANISRAYIESTRMKVSEKICNSLIAFSQDDQKIYRGVALSGGRQSSILDGNSGKSFRGFLLAAGAQL